MPRGIPSKKTTRGGYGFKIDRKLYALLVGTTSQLVRAYADGMRNGGSVDWSSVDRAHEMALRSQRMILRQRRGVAAQRRLKRSKRGKAPRA